jgi:2-hydroxychromene-2-carboxylate isomerase
MAARLDFWFEFASTYSYLAAARIEGLAAERGVAVAWRPFLLGPIFGAQGWTTSPFNIYEAKGRNMWRDMERTAALHRLPFAKPSVFPQNGLKAARLALALPEGPRRAALVRAVYEANFVRGLVISDDPTLDAILADLNEDSAALREAAASPAIKDALRVNTDEAIAKGVFGAPAFTCVDGELFWGHDRLDQALDWAIRLEHEGISA